MNTIVTNQILFNGVDIFSLSSSGIRDLYTILFATSISHQMTMSEVFNAVIAKLTSMIHDGQEGESLRFCSLTCSFQKLGIQIAPNVRETRRNRFSTSTYRNIATTLYTMVPFFLLLCAILVLLRSRILLQPRTLLQLHMLLRKCFHLQLVMQWCYCQPLFI